MEGEGKRRKEEDGKRIDKLLKRRRSENLNLDSFFANRLALERRNSWKEGVELQKTEEKLKKSNEKLGLLLRRQKSELFWREKKTLQRNKSQIFGKMDENKSFLENFSSSKPSLLRQKSQLLSKQKSVDDFGPKKSFLGTVVLDQSLPQKKTVLLEKRKSADQLVLGKNVEELGLELKKPDENLNNVGSSSGTSFSVGDLSFYSQNPNEPERDALSEKMRFSLGSAEWLGSDEEEEKEEGGRRRRRRKKEGGGKLEEGEGGLEEGGEEMEEGGGKLKEGGVGSEEEGGRLEEGGEKILGRKEEREEGWSEWEGGAKLNDKGRREEGGKEKEGGMEEEGRRGEYGGGMEEGWKEEEEEGLMEKEVREDYSKVTRIKEKPYIKLKKFRLLGNIDHAN